MTDSDSVLMTFAITMRNILEITIYTIYDDGTIEEMADETNNGEEEIWTVPAADSSFDLSPSSSDGGMVVGIIVLINNRNNGETFLVNMDIEACIKTGECYLVLRDLP